MIKYILLALVVTLGGCYKKIVHKDLTDVKSVMVVFAHADDETTISPALARFNREGVDVHLVIATDGRHGTRPHMGVPAGDELAAIRVVEIQCAAEKIGVSSLILLNFEDGTLSDHSNLNRLGKNVDSLYRLIEPNIMISWGPDGGYGHPDHRAVSNIVTEVFQKYRPDEAKKLLYFAISEKEVSSLPSSQSELGRLLQATWKTTHIMPSDYAVTVTSDDMATGRDALSCHESQFTKEEMEDFYKILHPSSNIIYFRAWPY